MIEFGPTVSPEVILKTNRLILAFSIINIGNTNLIFTAGCRNQHFPSWTHYLASAGKDVFVCSPFLVSISVCRDRENPIFKGPGDHGRLAMWHHQIGRMTQQMGASQSQRSGGLRESPIKTNHHANLTSIKFMYFKGFISRFKPFLLVHKKVNFPVDPR